MQIEKVVVSIVSNKDPKYDETQVCQNCGETIHPIRQGNGIDYYYFVGDVEDYGRAIDPHCLGIWLGKIGQNIADDPHPRWLHAAINKK